MIETLKRKETRVERYTNKVERARVLPASLVSVNFRCDDNLAYLIRTAACFGIQTIHVIGSIPSRKNLFGSSGSLVDYIKLKQFKSPADFLKFARNNNYKLVSAELTDGAKSLYGYEFDLESHTAIVLGNETSGVPNEIIMNSDPVFIPMGGVGFCLNTSQTGTAFVSEYSRQVGVRDGRVMDLYKV